MITPVFSRIKDSFEYLPQLPSLDDTDGFLKTITFQRYEDDKRFVHLRCTCSLFLRKNWCPHMEVVYTDKAEFDAETLTAKMGIHLFKPPHQLIVPILVLPSSDHKISEVKILFGSISSIGREVASTGMETIGHILTNKQGRRSIRILVMDWIVGIPDIYPGKMKCDKSFHASGDSYFDSPQAPGMVDPQIYLWRIRDSYSLLDTSMCYKCLEITTNSQQST